MIIKKLKYSGLIDSVKILIYDKYRQKFKFNVCLNMTEFEY